MNNLWTSNFQRYKIKILLNEDTFPSFYKWSGIPNTLENHSIEAFERHFWNYTHIEATKEEIVNCIKRANNKELNILLHEPYLNKVRLIKDSSYLTGIVKCFSDGTIFTSHPIGEIWNHYEYILLHFIDFPYNSIPLIKED